MTPPISAVRLSRDLCTNLPSAEQREWLVTNGLGGFACGTVAGTLTRRYHGLLIAALSPPRARTLLVTKIDEIARIKGTSVSLGANRWSGGAIDPQGFSYLTEFHLEGSMPVWTYALQNAQLEKRIWMQHGANTTYVEYRLVQSDAPVELECKILVNYRDFNNLTRANGWRMQIDNAPNGLRITAFDNAAPFYLRSAAATAEPAGDAASPPGALWYRNYELAEERGRGLEDCEDHLCAAVFRVTLQPGATASLVFTTDPNSSLDAAAAFAFEQSRERDLLTRFAGAQSQTDAPLPAAGAPAWIQQLVLAADQFLVSSGKNQAAETPCEIIAGYPWFGVWSRDAMISLPGLTLSTGRPGLARRLLRTFAQQIDRGMLPNFFPDSAQPPPEYNSADAPLWFIEALRQYVDHTGDLDLVRELFPSAQNIISAYSQGTRYSIHVDSADGLVHCGEPGTQVTWMDARVNGVAATPRVGKPVEINALWLNALATTANLAPHCGVPATEFQRQADQARKGFSRFWNANANCCFDVIDGPNGNDASLRPNQIFAVSLSVSALTAAQQRAVVDSCAAHLLAPCGLRSLAPEDPKYCGHYDGPQVQRDAAYHQGTVWAWLLGPFIEAHWKVYRDRAAIDRIVGSIASHLTEAGLGTISEIFDGDAPFTPRGCFAQAWSVAEILRAWKVVAG
ncbi:MAG TPA: amylo-alpha-1,6-glucosidase [Candidatus Acidoferrales bacterium]|nr:amylo-alpha-1,6-glucosidase [Candidatus Acidoferrales bacterium]